MEKMILLMKDNTIISTYNWKRLYENIKYILCKVDDQLDTFIALKPNKYLLELTKIKINFEAIITQHNVDETAYDSYTSGFCKVDKNFTSIYESIQYIHSLNRIQYANEIMNSNDCPIYEEIKFCYFKIDGYKNGRKIYHYKNTVKKERKFFGPKEILRDIEGLYNPFMKGEECFLIIDPIIKRWKFSESLIRNSLCGVPLSNTKSFVFYEPEIINLLNEDIKSLYCQTWIYDNKEYDNTSLDELHDLYDEAAWDVEYGENRQQFQSVRLIDYWSVNIFTLFEFITYLSYLYIIIQTTKEVNDKGEYKHQYSSKSYFMIDLKYTNPYVNIPEFTSTDDDAISIDDLVYLIGGEEFE